MQVFLDAFIPHHLVESFAHQWLAEATQLISRVRAVDYLEEVVLLEQSYRLVYSFQIDRVLAQGRDFFQSFEAELVAQDRADLDYDKGRGGLLELAWLFTLALRLDGKEVLAHEL